MRYLLMAAACLAVAGVIGCPTPPAEDDDVVVDDDLSDDDVTADDDDDVTADDDDDVTADDDDTTPDPDDQDGDGFTLDDGDCDDLDATVHPGADETICDQVDSDCDGWGEGIVAAVGELEFASIPGALTALHDGDVLSICPGVHTDQIYIDDDLAVSVTAASGNADDTILDGQGDHTVIYAGHNTLVTISHLTIRNGQGEPWIGGDYAGGGIMSFATQTVVEDCVFTDNHVDLDPESGEGGAIAVEEFVAGQTPIELRVLGCRFERNQVVRNGGAINVHSINSVTVEITDSTFTDNSAGGDGGGALRFDGDPIAISISGSSFTGNTATNTGGAAQLRGWEVLSISQTTFCENVANYEGGALYLDPHYAATILTTSATFTDCTFEANDAADSGGAIAAMTYVNDTMDLCFDTATFDGNHSGHSGGALDAGFVGGYTVSAYDTVFSNNTADVAAGAIYFNPDGPSSWWMEGGEITNNSSNESSAAALFLGPDDGAPNDVYLYGVSITDNDNISGHRGAIYANDNTTLTLESCTLARNTGAGVYLRDTAETSLISIDTDWSVLPDDNDPYDVNAGGAIFYSDFGPNETFTCTGDLGCL